MKNEINKIVVPHYALKKLTWDDVMTNDEFAAYAKKVQKALSKSAFYWNCYERSISISIDKMNFQTTLKNETPSLEEVVAKLKAERPYYTMGVVKQAGLELYVDVIYTQRIGTGLIEKLMPSFTKEVCISIRESDENIAKALVVSSSLIKKMRDDYDL